MVHLDDNDEEEEMFSSSSTDRLIKTAFARREIEQFLNVCLLQKRYMKTLETSTDDENEVSSTVNQILDRVCGDDEDEDDLNLATRIAKRASINDESRQIKRFRSMDM